MAFSKITLNNETLIDVTNLTATQDKVLNTYDSIGADGVHFTGSYIPSEGSGNVIRETIVPETTVTATAGEWARLTTGSTPSLINGEYYSYTINGTEYLATATTNGNVIYLSDILWDWDKEGNNAIGYDIQYGGIWLNPSANGTYTVKVDKITLSSGTTWETLADQDITVVADSPNYFIINDYTEPFSADEKYRVTWAGTTYICETFAETSGTAYDGYALGNKELVGIGEDTGEPFFLYRDRATRALGVTNRSAGTLHIKIEREISSSVTLIEKTITQNGTYSAEDDDADGYSEVTVNISGALPTTVIIPEQTVTASGEATLLSNYTQELVEGDIYLFTVNGESTISTGTIIYGAPAVISDNYSIRVENDNAGHVYFTVYDSSLYGTYTIKVEKVLSLDYATLTAKTITANGTYNASSDNADGYSSVTVNVPSSGSPTLQSKSVSYTPTTSQQTASVTADSGYDGLSAVNVTVDAMPTGTAGTPSATKGSVSNYSISVTPSVTNTTGYITGGTQTGTAVTVSASELVSGTLSITSSGTKDVTNYASASVAAGTAGTPTATKGSVSNHSITVTPSVTNTTGYITGGTKTGTAVTVSASELVSGNLALTDNGTNINVTNYATVSVAVPFVTYYTGTSDPSSSTGSNGDIYLKVVS